MTVQLNLDDSVSVRRFIRDHNLCQKLAFVEQNKAAFVNEKGYSMMILGNIAKETKAKIFMTTATRHFLVDEKFKVDELQEQIDEIRSANGCGKR